MASLVVFLVALPLSLGIALASGAPVEAGIISAVCGGILVGLFGGAPLQASGPAAGLTVMVFGFVQQFGFKVTCAITVAAGLCQIILGALRVGRATLAISPAVIHGMLAGIGILISLSQIHVLLGHSPGGSGLGNLLKIPSSLFGLSATSTTVGALVLMILFGWKYTPARNIKSVPSSLVAIILATSVAEVFRFDVTRVQIKGDLLAAISLPVMPDSSSIGSFLTAVLAMTLIASAESLLCAVATDKLHNGPRANLNKELVGQGIANMVSGGLGGLPVTGVIVRSAANIASGAKTRWSTIMHGLWVLIFVTQFSFLINRIPLAALAGLLVFVGVNLVKPADIKHLAHYKEAWIYAATVCGVVFINLLAGIGIGIALSVGALLWKLSRPEMTKTKSKSGYSVRFTGALTFLAIPRLSQELSQLGEQCLNNGRGPISLEFDVDYIDAAAIDSIYSWQTGFERMGGTVNSPDLHGVWKDSRNHAEAL